MILDFEKMLLIMARQTKTKQDIQKQAKISNSTLKRIQDGEAVGTKTAGKLAKTLGVDVTDLLKS